MRARQTGDPQCAQFAAKLLKIGNGDEPYISQYDEIQIPDGLGTCVSTLAELKQAIFPDLNANISSREWIRER